VRGIHAHNRPVGHAGTGERCALNLAGNFPDGAEPGRGDWVLAPQLHAPVGRLDVGVAVSRAAPVPLRDGLHVHVHLGTEDRVGRVAVLGRRTLAAGERGFVRLDLDRPIGALWGDRVVLRDHGALNTLAGGRVVDPFPPRRGRSRPERLAAVAAMQEADPGSALENLLDLGGVVTLAPFALARNLAAEELDSLIEAGGFLRLGSGREALAAAPERLAALGQRLEEELREWHRAQPDALGMARPALLRRLKGAAPEPALDAALAQAAAAGRIVRDGAVLRLPEHRPRLTREDERLWQRVEELLAAGALRPPRLRELAGELGLDPDQVARLFKRFERFGRVAPVAANRYFLPETITRLADIARELADADPGGSFTAQLFKDRSGVGRNLTIEILEYLDRIGVTRRVGDTRVVLRRGDAAFG
jgi:selenocysteine-specific elongation factor